MVPDMRRLMIIAENAFVRAPREAVDVTSSQFRRWFGQSKVVDGQGLPLRLYHGTKHDIHTFRGMVWGSVTPVLAGEYADALAGSNIMPLFMRIERPFDADLGLSRTVTISEFFNAAIEQAIENGFASSEINGDTIYTFKKIIQSSANEMGSGPHYNRYDFWFNVEGTFGTRGERAIRDLFQLLGFDGVRMIERGEVTYGAFHPEQVKSVFNQGGFDPQSAHISERAILRHP